MSSVRRSEAAIWNTCFKLPYLRLSVRNLIRTAAPQKISLTSSLCFASLGALRPHLNERREIAGHFMGKPVLIFALHLKAYPRIGIGGWKWTDELTSHFWSVPILSHPQTPFDQTRLRSSLFPLPVLRCSLSRLLCEPCVPLLNTCWKWKEAIDFSMSQTAIC